MLRVFILILRKLHHWQYMFCFQRMITFRFPVCSVLGKYKLRPSRRMRWAGHVARMGEDRGAYRVLVGKPEGKRPLGRPRLRWENNIKMDL
jgi:hypothetical protein